MSRNTGWICLHRSIEDHWLWDEKPFSPNAAWIDLLLLANHDSHIKKIGNGIVTMPPGTINRSVTSLADRWGWDRKKASRFLEKLELDDMVTVSTNRARGLTTITIENYGKYQNQCP